MSVKAIVDTAYARLERAAESSHEASKLLRAALDAAVTGERAHRRMGAGFGATYQASVQTAARYFVCKWFCVGGQVNSARDACSMRGDCLNAMALRELLDGNGVRLDLPGIPEIDYSTDIAGRAP